MNLKREELKNLLICGWCGQCIVDCPVFKASGNTRHLPLFKSRLFRRVYETEQGIINRISGEGSLAMLQNLSREAGMVYECTLCGACTENCKYDIKPHNLWYRLREYLNSKGYNPEPLKAVEENFRRSGNPYGLSPSARKFWLRKASRKYKIPIGKAETIYFIGCTTSAKAVNRPTAESLFSILNAAGINWAILGIEEPCCGAPLEMIGSPEMAREQARRVVEALESAGAETVITSCPTCFRELSVEYERILGYKPSFKVVPAVKYILELLDEGLISLEPAQAVKIAYHDPCELSRHMDVVDEPRKLLEMMGFQFVEPEYAGRKTFCCGGGGMLKAENNDLSVKVATVRVNQLLKNGATMISTACPSCKASLQEAAANIGGAKVYDIIELVAERIAKHHGGGDGHE